MVLLAMAHFIFSQCSKEEEPVKFEDSDGNVYQTR
jgi:hypothetical protein